MTIALTGANGFLGAYVVREFLDNQCKVIALVRASANVSTIPEHTNLSIECINYSQDLAPQFASLKEKHGELTYFVHNAGVTVSLDNEEYFRINAGLTQSILTALEQTAWLSTSSKFIYISSMAAQGPFGINQPVSNYGKSKKEAEKIIQKSDFSYLIIRPTGIYGAGDYAFLPLFKLAAKGFYPLPNNKQKMSMIHAKDLAYIIFSESAQSTGILHATDGVTYLHDDFIKSLMSVTEKKIRKFPTPPWVSKLSLGFSDAWYRLIDKRPGLTLEKFQEISMDWHLHEDSSLEFSKIPSQISLREGFRDAYDFYKAKKLL